MGSFFGLYLFFVTAFIGFDSWACFEVPKFEFIDRSSNHDSLKITYHLQIIRDDENSKGDNYSVEFSNVESQGAKITRTGQTTWITKYDIVCPMATIYKLRISLPGERIMWYVIDQNNLINQSEPINLDIYVAERRFDKDQYTLLRFRVDKKGAAKRARFKFLDQTEFEQYK